MIYIKYSGTMPDKDSIIKMEEELIDISQISGWAYELVAENFNTLTSASRRGLPERADLQGDLDDEDLLTLSSADVYLEGIALQMDRESEPLKFTFDKNGKLATISFCTTDTVGLNKKLTVKKYEFLYYPYIKMYTPNADRHVQIIKLLDYMKKKYIKDLQVIDTSLFWETRDDEELKVKMWKAGSDRKLII
jgi:hypothetical protein